MEQTPNKQSSVNVASVHRCSEKMKIAFLTDSLCVRGALGYASSPEARTTNGAYTPMEYVAKYERRDTGAPGSVPDSFNRLDRAGNDPRRLNLLSQPYHFPVGGKMPNGSPRKQRAPRMVYTEEQKFFIMYARIVQDQSWSEIEDRFGEIFGHRSKEGITSMYYRIRKSWGLKEILKAGPQSFAEDKEIVYYKAAYFSSNFLLSVGYLA